MELYLRRYFELLHSCVTGVACSEGSGHPLSIEEAYGRAARTVCQATAGDNKLMFIGNGGSAAIASHMAIDFTKNGRMRAMAFNDGAALTCLSNDLGYDEVFATQLELHSRRNDVLVAISSSGRSPNILRGVDRARERGCDVITFSGFSPDNPLRGKGDVNFFLASHEYGFVEIGHLALIHGLLDLIMSGAMASNMRAAPAARVVMPYYTWSSGEGPMPVELGQADRQENVQGAI
jgi:D-sedoheptulose 7-phosphate isomerase